jgi:RNA polymerase sigma factor (sigma-70 family)
MSAGREAAEFCTELRPRLVGSLVLFCGDRSLGEELAQEAIVRALERWDRVRYLACPEAWVFRVGFNLARSSRQRRIAEQRATQRLAARGEGHTPLPDTPTAVTVRSAVEGLPPRQRAVIIARFYAGMDIKTTAATLGCAEGTVKALSHKAMLRLRRCGLIDDDPEVIPDVRS